MFRILATFWLYIALVSPLQAAKQPLIAAASSLQFALDEIAAAYTHDTGQRIRIVYGSSGNFARQIRQGAPYELFMAADQSYIEKLISDDLTLDQGKVYAVGRIALAVPPGSPLKSDATLRDLQLSITDGRLKRFAIANPEHAPYGERAKQALHNKALWQSMQNHLVLGENVSQAAQFALSPNTQGGIVAWSLAKSPTLAGKAQFTLLPEEFHQPLLQQMVLLKGSSDIAAQFYRYLQQANAIAILQSYGFTQPGTLD